MDQESLAHFLDITEAQTKPGSPAPSEPSCILASVLAIGNAGDPEDVEAACIREAELCTVYGLGLIGFRVYRA